MRPRVTLLLLAAGASSRMGGRDKLLEPVGGEPLLRRQARAAVASGAPVIVALPPDRPERLAALHGLELAPVIVPEAAQGMGRSLATGARAAGRPGGLMILPADMPGLGTPEIRAMLDAFDGQAILRGCTPEGTPGHPVLFPRDLLPELADLSGDAGAREVLVRHCERVRPVPLPGLSALTDLDTPEDWVAWRAGDA